MVEFPGEKAAEILGKELDRQRSRRDKARVASRILTEEFERLDHVFAVARNSETAYWPDLAALSVPAWDEHKTELADLLDDQTWEATKAAATLPKSVILQASADSSSAELITGIRGIHLTGVTSIRIPSPPTSCGARCTTTLYVGVTPVKWIPPTGIMDALHMSNAAARAKLVSYASKPGVLGWLSRAWKDGRRERRDEILRDE